MEKKWSIKQVINGVTYFNQSFISDLSGYEILKNILYLPKSVYTNVKELKKFKTIRIYDNRTHKSFDFYNVVTLPSITTKKVSEFLRNKRYNCVSAHRILFYYVYDFNPPNVVNQGKNYEQYIANLFKSKGYQVIENYKKQKEDEGIDIIAIKNDELLLIQCKNWQKFIITHQDIKEFLGNCYLFLYKNVQYRKYKKVRRLFIVSQSNIDDSARNLLKNYTPFIELLNIPYK